MRNRKPVGTQPERSSACMAESIGPVPILRANGLYQIAYCSRSRIGGGPMAVTETVRSLITVSRCNNDRLGITSALLFSQNHFAQVLEGPHSGVMFVFNQIMRDPRHKDVVLLHQACVASRAFGAWPMTFVRTATLPDLMIEPHAMDEAMPSGSASGAALLAMMRHFVSKRPLDPVSAFSPNLKKVLRH